MTRVKRPSQGLGELVAVVDDPRQMMHLHNAALTPLLNSKVLDVDVAGARRRVAFVDHGDGGLIVNVERRCTVLFKAQLVEDGSKVLRNLGSMYSPNELGFSRAGGNSGLEL